jgi:hypothetical protein
VQRFLDSVPAHLVGVRPNIQLNGVATATGNRVGMGEAQTATVHFSAPTVRTADVTLDLIAWGRFGITLDYAGISESMLRARNERLQLLAQELQSGNGPELSASPFMAAFHDLIISSWFFSVDHDSEQLSKASKVRYARYPSIGFAYPEFNVDSTFGAPTRLSGTAFFLDIARQFQVATALGGDKESEIGFNITTGFISSQLEGTVLARLMSGQNAPPPGISAVSALRSASTQGIPVHAINATNVDTVLPGIADSFPKRAISDAVNAGQIVLVPQSPPVINEVSVNGYITLDPLTGEGAYLIGRAGAGEVRLRCRSSLSPEERARCEMWLNYADFLEAVGTILLFIVALAAIAIALSSGVFALIAAKTVFATILSLGQVLGASLSLAMIYTNFGCYLQCFNTNSAGPGCPEIRSPLGCGTYSINILLFGIGLDDIFDVVENLSQTR